MVEKVERNAPCPCGSGKKYKNCCMRKDSQQQTVPPMGKRKFKAVVLSQPSGASQPAPKEEGQVKPVDYTLLMERSFGESLHTHEDKPPVPLNPSEYLVDDDTK